MKRLRGERGANLVEFAIVLPILIALIFGIVEFGFTFNSYLELRSGSREGARLAAVNNGCAATATGCPETAIEERDALIAKTRTRLTGLANPSKIGVAVSFPDGSTVTGKDVRVCVYYQINTVTGLFPFLNGKMLKSVAYMRLEQNATFSDGESPSTPAPSGASPCA